MSYEYDRYLAQHKSNVEAGFRWLQKNLPEITEGIGAEHNIVFAHDQSKTEPDEYGPYDISYHSGLIDRVMEEKFPITMPYFPESKPFRVYCEEFLTDRKNGDFDTVGILYAIKPDGERVEINRYFREGEKDFIEIASCEYEMRRKMYHELLENLKKEKNSNESE